MIEIKNIHKQFGIHHVLKGINLTVRKGEVVTIIGPSGSGKTTFYAPEFIRTAGRRGHFFTRQSD